MHTTHATQARNSRFCRPLLSHDRPSRTQQDQTDPAGPNRTKQDQTRSHKANLPLAVSTGVQASTAGRLDGPGMPGNCIEGSAPSPNGSRVPWNSAGLPLLRMAVITANRSLALECEDAADRGTGPGCSRSRPLSCDWQLGSRSCVLRQLCSS